MSASLCGRGQIGKGSGLKPRGASSACGFDPHRPYLRGGGAVTIDPTAANGLVADGGFRFVPVSAR